MGKRILLLEKERNLAHFLSLELQKEQYRVDLVEKGQKALSMALQTDYESKLKDAQNHNEIDRKSTRLNSSR